jgi:hypothetical protein
MYVLGCLQASSVTGNVLQHALHFSTRNVDEKSLNTVIFDKL